MANQLIILEPGTDLVGFTKDGKSYFVEKSSDAVSANHELTAIKTKSKTWIWIDGNNSLDDGSQENNEPFEYQNIEFMVITDPELGMMRPIIGGDLLLHIPNEYQ